MQIFYAPGIIGDTYILDEKESRHCIRVLRMSSGTPVKLIDGRGNLYEGTISKPDPRGCFIVINNKISEFEKRPYKLHIALSPLKNTDRFEWFIEKSVEIGIDEITPIICKNTEKQSIKPERINNIIISAMKQSLKARLTILNNLCSFDEFVYRTFNGAKIIAHCHTTGERSALASVYTKGEDAIILIGPEGDFSNEEVFLSVKEGFKPIHLGTSRLRSETAAIIACHSVYFLNQ